MGFLLPARDYAETAINLQEALVLHPLSTFIVRVDSDSMINAFIAKGALLVVDRSLTPQNGDIVIAVVNGEFYVRYIRKNDYTCWLVPANNKYRELKVTPEMNMAVWGVVTYIITDPKANAYGRSA